jgi:hypothetical protein
MSDHGRPQKFGDLTLQYFIYTVAMPVVQLNAKAKKVYQLC